MKARIASDNQDEKGVDLMEYWDSHQAHLGGIFPHDQEWSWGWKSDPEVLDIIQVVQWIENKWWAEAVADGSLI